MSGRKPLLMRPFQRSVVLIRRSLRDEVAKMAAQNESCHITVKAKMYRPFSRLVCSEKTLPAQPFHRTKAAHDCSCNTTAAKNASRQIFCFPARHGRDARRAFFSLSQAKTARRRGRWWKAALMAVQGYTYGKSAFVEPASLISPTRRSRSCVVLDFSPRTGQSLQGQEGSLCGESK